LEKTEKVAVRKEAALAFAWRRKEFGSLSLSLKYNRKKGRNSQVV